MGRLFTKISEAVTDYFDTRDAMRTFDVSWEAARDLIKRRREWRVRLAESRT